MLLETKNLGKTYQRGSTQCVALCDVSLTIEKGEFVSIMGKSGSGKSTLLHLIGGLDRPSQGQVLFEGRGIEKFSDQELSLFRRRKLGFIFQFFNLMPTLSAIENVALPRLLDGESLDQIRKRAEALLDTLGLTARLDHRPDQLSGGEMQRVAIARALVTEPLLLLADEPTGNLDSKTGLLVLKILRSIVKEMGQTLVMVTHDPNAAAFADRVIFLKDGRVESDRRQVPREIQIDG